MRRFWAPAVVVSVSSANRKSRVAFMVIKIERQLQAGKELWGNNTNKKRHAVRAF